MNVSDMLCCSLVICFIVNFICMIICRQKAKEKGYSPLAFEVFAFFLGIVAWVIIEIVPDKNQ